MISPIGAVIQLSEKAGGFEDPSQEATVGIIGSLLNSDQSALAHSGSATRSKETRPR
jgi:hypothetical protein